MDLKAFDRPDQAGLREAGIAVEADSFYVKSTPDATQLAEAANFAKKFLQ